MLHTIPRRTRAPGVALLACLVVAGAGGCARTVTGSGSAAGTGVAATIPTPLTELLIDPQRLPDPYRGADLDAAAVDRAVRDLDGVPAAADVDPPRCAPAAPGPAPHDAVAVRGTDPATASSLTVALTRTDRPLAERRAQWADCSSFSYTVDGSTHRVTAALPPEPPVDADSAYALELAVSGGPDGDRRLLVLVAQVADVRVAAAWAGRGDPAANSAALDLTFRDAVLQVNRGRPR